MKGGGLTWAGWLMVGAGSMLVYAGMTGQSLVSELAAVLNGRGLKVDPAASDPSIPATKGVAYPLQPRPTATLPPASPRVAP